MTGEERKYANDSDTPSSHVACTVEMTSVNIPCKSLISTSIEDLMNVLYFHR